MRLGFGLGIGLDYVWALMRRGRPVSYDSLLVASLACHLMERFLFMPAKVSGKIFRLMIASIQGTNKADVRKEEHRLRGAVAVQAA
jgi:hypothetical protein